MNHTEVRSFLWNLNPVLCESRSEAEDNFSVKDHLGVFCAHIALFTCSLGAISYADDDVLLQQSQRWSWFQALVGYFSSLGTAIAVMAVMVGTVMSLKMGRALGETDGLLWFSVSTIICRMSRLASPRTASKATMCSSLATHAHFSHSHTYPGTQWACWRWNRKLRQTWCPGTWRPAWTPPGREEWGRSAWTPRRWQRWSRTASPCPRPEHSHTDVITPYNQSL